MSELDDYPARQQHLALVQVAVRFGAVAWHEVIGFAPVRFDFHHTQVAVLTVLVDRTLFPGDDGDVRALEALERVVRVGHASRDENLA